ncbi:uncharacterized protein LOC115431801 [Sphaeramia orbicularis]|uniref:uncharacterized protein LOC115431801 n=1 Tax=Sphaeramia orbicularis TaxID=375764 RepID=UPI001180C380|nr:uncharacterized protein LOC115431801 [Sphaeramia orbicularis]
MDYLQQSSGCPACNHEYDVALILPCSHTMCRRCVTAAEGETFHHPLRHKAAQPACSVFCPCCCHPVELPCWTWSSATSSLPKHPILSSACDKQDRGTKEQASNDSLLSLQSDMMYWRDSSEETVQGVSQCFSAPRLSKVPVDGSVDLKDEEMEQSVYGLRFALDPSNVPPSIHLSSSLLTVTYQMQSSSLSIQSRWSVATPDPQAVLTLPQVCADVVIGHGQYYWEVDVCNSSVYRIGVSSLDGSGGWWFERQGPCFCAVYDGSVEPIFTVPPQIKTIGVFLSIEGCVLSFHNSVTQEHLTTFPTLFDAAGVTPALGLGQGQLRLRCGLPPPPYIFLSKDSAYRGPRGTVGAQWCRDIPFQSVRKVIQKFEELAASDSDSGVVSSLGSSDSTLVFCPEPIPRISPSKQDRKLELNKKNL